MTTTKESEKALEARLVREIEVRGGMALKYTSQYHRGIPDRIIFMPHGRTYFVELKSTGKKPTKLQDYAMRRIGGLGFFVTVIDNGKDLDAFIKQVEQDQTHYTIKFA